MAPLLGVFVHGASSWQVKAISLMIIWLALLGGLTKAAAERELQAYLDNQAIVVGTQGLFQVHKRLQHEEILGEDPCSLVRMRNKDTRQEVPFRRRSHPARVVDFIQFGFVHELPILQMRLAEMGPFVDEIHIAEGDRDFSGRAKQVLFPQLLANDTELAQWRGKIVHHTVHVPDSLRGYAIQAAVRNAKTNISGAGVLFEGDLDEIVSRTVLRSLRYCEPVTAKGWKGGIQMDTFMFNMGWTAGPWSHPSIVHDIETFTKEEPIALLHGVSSPRNLDDVRDSIYVMDGTPAGWHIAWTLDGADGIANKILHGHIEGIPSWARAHAESQKELAAWLRTVFLPNPTAYDSSIKASDLQVKDLPECVIENAYKYKALLGDAFSVALRPKLG